MGVHLTEWWVMAVCTFFLYARPMEWPRVQATVQFLAPWSSSARVQFTPASAYSRALDPSCMSVFDLVASSTPSCPHAQASLCGAGADIHGTCGTEVCVNVLELPYQHPHDSTMACTDHLVTSDHTILPSHLPALHSFVRYMGSQYSYYRPGRWVLGAVRGTAISSHALAFKASGVLPARWYPHISSSTRARSHGVVALLGEAASVLSSIMLTALTTTLATCSKAISQLCRNKSMVQFVTVCWVLARAFCKETRSTYVASTTNTPLTFTTSAFHWGDSSACTFRTAPLALYGGGAVLWRTLTCCACVVVLLLLLFLFLVTHVQGSGGSHACDPTSVSGAGRWSTYEGAGGRHNALVGVFAIRITLWRTDGDYVAPSADLTMCGDVESNPGPAGTKSCTHTYRYRTCHLNVHTLLCNA
jgi:hypothetical protein